jgi:cytoskeletal protein CcmA (bactofilin family)
MLTTKNKTNNQKSNLGLSGVNFIGKGTFIKGTFISDQDLRLDGTIEGDIEIKAKFVLGTDGKVKGKINAYEADISGKIEGEVSIKDLLTLRSPSVVEGDIVTNKINIESGAVFNGACIMSKNPDRQSPTKEVKGEDSPTPKLSNSGN